jgi:hypothetical protein
VAFVIKSFTDLNLATGSYHLNFTFVCYVQPHEKLNQRQRDYMAVHMKLRLDDQAGQLMLDPTEGEWVDNHRDNSKFIKFTVRRSEDILIPIEQQLKAVTNFPFDKFELHVRFEFESVWIPGVPEQKEKGIPGEEPVRVRFVVYHPQDYKLGFHRGARTSFAVDRLPEYRVDFDNRECWGGPRDKEKSQPVIIYKVEVARISLNVVWTTFFPMFATQALLVLLHTVESNIGIGDMATIMLALFAFLTSARDKIPVFPKASVLDKMVFCFVIQLIFVCVDLLYEYFFPTMSARARPVFLIVSTVGFSLQILYVAYRWAFSGLPKKSGQQLDVKGQDTRNESFAPENWMQAPVRKGQEPESDRFQKTKKA